MRLAAVSPGLMKRRAAGAIGAITSTAYNYYQFEVTGINGGSQLTCSELQMYESSGGTNYALATATFTWDGEIGSGGTPDKFNDNAFSFPNNFIANTGFTTGIITATLSAPKTLQEFIWWVPSGETARQPTGIIIRGSMDGSAWTTLKTLSSLTTGWVSAAGRTFDGNS
jgi:hypothetical protein